MQFWEPSKPFAALCLQKHCRICRNTQSCCSGVLSTVRSKWLLRGAFEATVRPKWLLGSALEATVRSKWLLQRALETTVRSGRLLGCACEATVRSKWLAGHAFRPLHAQKSPLEVTARHHYLKSLLGIAGLCNTKLYPTLLSSA